MFDLRRTARSLWPLALVFTIASCARTVRPPDLALLYDRVAQAHHVKRNPVVLIPGVLGSNLRDEETQRVVWGAFTGNYANPRRADGARLIALPMQRGRTLAELRDGVVEDGALESLRLTVFGLPIGVSAYVNILAALGVGGYVDEGLGLSGAIDYGDDHFTCFQFAYDWRRDLSESAAALHAFLLEREAYLREEYAARGIEREEIRFDFVAHSMGGLLLRYYMRYGAAPLPDDGSLPALTWAGAQRVGRAFLIGTPNAGSIQAFYELCDGAKIGPFLPRYPAAVIGTMPALYQLLPRARHGAWRADEPATELGDPLALETWEAFDWGLLHPSEDAVLTELLPEATPEERRAIARDHVAKCLARARQFHAALDVPAQPPDGTELFLTVGDAMSTPAWVEVNANGDFVTRNNDQGDGTVLRSSALLDERLGGTWQPELVSPIDWSRVMFFFEDHLGLTKAPAFIDNLLYALLEEPRR